MQPTTSFPTKTTISIISGMAKATNFKFSIHIHKTFRALIYKAHHAVIFAIAQLSWLLCSSPPVDPGVTWLSVIN